MQTTWIGILGLLVMGWLLVDGAVHGAVMTLRRHESGHRRGVLTGIGPFLLAGEVWLVAAAGLLLGVFPGAEHDLIYATYPVVVLLVAGWITRDAGVWFRSRGSSVRWRTWWERAAAAGAVGVAAAWGLVCGALMRGLPERADISPVTLLEPYSLLWGAFMIAGFAAHGAAFAARRAPAYAAPAARSMLVWPARTAAVLGVVVAAASLLADSRPLAAVLVAVAAASLAAAGLGAGARSDASSFALTGTALAASALAVGMQVAPWLRTGLAAQSTLDLLATVLLPVLVVMFGVQLWAAWLFRRRVDHRSAVFY